jgi:hypothetical protein
MKDRIILDAPLPAIRTWLTIHGGALDLCSDGALAQRIEVLGMQVRAHDMAGDTEKAHEASVELAAVTIYYMARGLS